MSFYFSYDTNMILRHLPDSKVSELAADGSCFVADPNDPLRGYVIEYQPKKKTVIRLRVKQSEDAKPTNITITIYDVWGFFQSSFVGALKQFGIGAAEELEAIESMKGARSEFDTKDFDKIAEYNASECRLLVQLMERVADRMESVGIRLAQWHGAGAVAAAIFKQHDVKRHLYKPEGYDHVLAVRSAYFGGRIQALKVGEFGHCFQYDIISAYPSVMRELSSLEGCTEEYTDEFIPDYPYAVYLVEWDIPDDVPVTPFPFRNKDGTIDYPYVGSGYYWFPEVDAALRHFPEYVKIVAGYVFKVRDLSVQPFEFINDMYVKRRELKKAGDYAQICLKLGLNSLYGKTAQSIGRKDQPPPYQCYIYAGYITSGTRAKMLDAAMQDPESVIAFATDGLLTTTEKDLPLETKLGNWEVGEYDTAFIIKPGFYEITKGDERSVRVRGFPMKSVNWDELREEFRRNGLNGKVEFDVRSFIGMKARSENRPWCSWIDSKRTMNFRPSRGIADAIGARQYRIIPPFVKDGVSAPYKKDAADRSRQFYDSPEREYFIDEE